MTVILRLCACLLTCFDLFPKWFSWLASGWFCFPNRQILCYCVFTCHKRGAFWLLESYLLQTYQGHYFGRTARQHKLHWLSTTSSLCSGSALNDPYRVLHGPWSWFHETLFLGVMFRGTFATHTGDSGRAQLPDPINKWFDPMHDDAVLENLFRRKI